VSSAATLFDPAVVSARAPRYRYSKDRTRQQKVRHEEEASQQGPRDINVLVTPIWSRESGFEWENRSGEKPE
jgi:hypothetical protein